MLHLVSCYLWFSSLDLCVMDLSSSNELPIGTSPARNPFLNLVAFLKQLRS